MEEVPDLSHLTPEERAIIESVMVRQKQEEEREREIMRKKADEVQILEETIKARNEQHKKAGIELEATCQICLKTKFADGIGHICNYCSIRCCARCGGKVTLRSNKIIWVCILCRKKQELLSKTGKWIIGGPNNIIDDDSNNGDIQLINNHHQHHQPFDKRPKLERAHSASEKENQPILHHSQNNLLLKRQYSEQDNSNNRTTTILCDELYNQQYNEDDPRYYHDELEGLMRNHPHLVPRRYPIPSNTTTTTTTKTTTTTTTINDDDISPMEITTQQKIPFYSSNSNRKHKRSGSIRKHPYSPQQQLQHSYSSSEEDLKSTPEYGSDDRDSEKEVITNQSSMNQWHDEHEYDNYERPHVLVTSPASPERPHPPLSLIQNNVGGKIQISLNYDITTLQLMVTIISAYGLIPRSTTYRRNPYCKIFLLPDKSEKSKRRTKTLAGTITPLWDQTFIYYGLRKSDLKLRTLEITVWDYVKYEPNDFLGECLIDLWPLDEQPKWYDLKQHEDIILTPSEHLSPPSTSSRFSDSDTTPSECDLDGGGSGGGGGGVGGGSSGRERRGADGASVSSIGSSGSPPREYERRSRRDQEPLYNYGNQNHRRVNIRSHSAAPCDSPSIHMSRSRSKSPRRSATSDQHRSLSPPYQQTTTTTTSSSSPYRISRFQSRSETATPTGSPKKRQLPQVPHMLARALQERVTQDLEERNNRQQHHKIRYINNYRNSIWDRRYSGLSDSDLTNHYTTDTRRLISPERDREQFGLVDFDSDMESVASVTSSAFSTQSERPRGTRQISNDYEGGSDRYEYTTHPTRNVRSLEREMIECEQCYNEQGHQRHHHHHHNQHHNNHHHHHHHNNNNHNHNQHETHHRGSSIRKGQFTRSLSNAEETSDDKADGSLSDTAVTHLHGLEVPKLEPRKPENQSQMGLNKKSNSASELSSKDVGYNRKRTSTSSSIQRSQEVVPTRSQERASSLNSISSSEASSWSPSLRLAGESGQLSEFIDGLGPGQLVGRQVLGAPALGDIQLSLCHQKGFLEIEVIRARGLQARPGCKVLPAPYVKVYLVSGKKCIAKAKTSTARRTLDPLYQQQLAFKENFHNCILQVTVWGDYGRIEGKKVFMGVAQIMLDDLNLSNIVIGWYKLFGTTSLVSGTTSLGLSRRNSMASLDSLKM